MNSETPSAPGESIQEIIAHLEAGEPALADGKAEEILNRDPKNFDALHFGAVAKAQTGKLQEAIAMFDTALELRDDVPDLHNNLGNTLMQLGRVEDAIASYRRALEIRPNYPEAQDNLASTLMSARYYDEAIKAYKDILRQNPGSVKALVNLGTACLELGRPEGTVTWFQRALITAPDEPDIHNKLGFAYSMLHWHEEAIASYKRAIELQPDLVAAHANLARAFLELKRYRKAISCCERVIELDPGRVDAHSNLGASYLKSMRHEEAATALLRAIELNAEHVSSYSNLGMAYLGLNRFDEAVECLERALDIDPDHSAAHINLGIAFSRLYQHEKAISSLRRAIELRPGEPKGHNSLGVAYASVGRYQEASASYRRAIELCPDYVEAHHNFGITQRALGRRGEAISSFKRALEIRPDYAKSLGYLAGENRSVCEWSDFAEIETALTDSVRSASLAFTPFTLLAFSDEPADIVQSAKKFFREKVGYILPLDLISPQIGNSRVRLAYLSADFHEHATAYLMAELFECHDRDKFEIHAISFGPDKPNAMRTRLEAAFDHWHEVSMMGDREAAELIRSLGIHIAVDLKGYTKNSRPGILAYRPAPIQVNYLGYPASMGAPFIDYILVDRYIVPANQKKHFTEKLVHLPNCYQVNDTKREIAAESPSRADCGLPEEGFVFCCFNNTNKLTPAMFDIWMRLLRQVDGSALWLIQGNALAEKNLRREAEVRGVDPGRLIFAPRKPLAEHLARYRRADLFLDTLPYNAHTTSSDALWVGLPVVTCSGKSFTARVAGSILQAAGLPELITQNLADYEALALKLASEPDLLATYRQRLAENRDSAPLFDCARFTRNLESAYITMRDRWLGGEKPKAFAVKE